MKLISESDTSVTSEVLLSTRLLDCTKDKELALLCHAMPCLALPCLALPADYPMAPLDMGMVRSFTVPWCQALHKQINKRVPIAKCCSTTAVGAHLIQPSAPKVLLRKQVNECVELNLSLVLNLLRSMEVPNSP